MAIPLPVFRPKAGAVPNQLVIKLAPNADADSVAALHRRSGARVVSEIPQIGAQTIQLPNPRAADAYRNHPLVHRAGPNHYRSVLVADPDDFYFSRIDTNTDMEYEWEARPAEHVAGWTVWPNQYFTAAGGKGSAGVLIAVIDTGIDYSHPDFRNRGGTSSNITGGGQLARSLDRTIFDGSVTADAPDGYGHGTFITGIAAAGTNNIEGVTGVGYNANVMSLRVTDEFGNGSESDVAAAIVYAADNGAVVCNISLGGWEYSQVEQDAVNYAWNRGMLVVAAAGNDGLPNSPNYPAALNKVLAVSATNSIDDIASYSNRGAYVGIAAPGGDIEFTGEFGVTNTYIWSTTPTYPVTITEEGVDLNYFGLNGTSVASPQIVGLAALYAGMKGIGQSTPNGPRQIWQAIQRGSDGAPGHNPFVGFGRINVFGTMNLDSVPNPGGDTSGCITGQIRYKDTPVSNAAVTAVPVGGGTSFSGTSRLDGNYRVVNAPAGNYNVTARFFGETQVLSNVVVTAGCDIPAIDFNIGGVPAASYTLTASPSTVSAGDSIAVNWTAPAGRPSTDWIGLFPANTLNNGYISWIYTGGATSGTWNLTAPSTAGTYQFRYLLENGFNSVATSNNVSVQPVGSYTLTPSATSVARNAPLSISWTAPTGRPTNDWIGLYRVGTANTAYLWWSYTGGAASGTKNLTAPAESGNYEFRYLQNGGYTSVATSATVNVTSSGSYSLTPSPTTVARGGALSISWTAPSGSSATDWIALFRVGDPNSAYTWWTYTNGTTSGTANLTAPSTAGSYEFRYFLNGGGMEAARSQTVTVN